MDKEKITTIGPDDQNRKLFGARSEKEEKHVTFSKVLCVFSDVLLLYSLILATFAICKYFEIIESWSTSESLGYSTQPDLSFLGFLLPAAFVFAGLTHTFYYNKERFANCIKIRFEYIKQLLLFKLNSGLYDKQELIMQVDNAINQAECEAEALISNDVNSAEQEQSNIVV